MASDQKQKEKKITHVTESNTRKKTSRGDYELEQNVNARFYDYYSNPANYFGRATKTMIPGNGFVGASLNLFDSQTAYMPDPMVVHRGQRPMFK